VTVWAKTGTAQSSRRVGEAVGDGPPEVREGNHAWVVGMVGNEGQEPRYAFAVMMEYAGSGGRVSGPIANQLIHALIAEGYLGEDDARGDGDGDGGRGDGRSVGGSGVGQDSAATENSGEAAVSASSQRDRRHG
jgi:hypothetical protein